MEFTTGNPVVKLLANTEKPFDTAIASARTCYSPGLVFASDVTTGQRERIGTEIYKAGHHTPFQHPTFTFGLDNISRHFVWSFLHSHPFYNSDQTSQRYVTLDAARVYLPEMDGKCQKLYKSAVVAAWEAYNELSELLREDNSKVMKNIGRIKGQTDKEIGRESERKAIETARYVVPIAAFTTMYHTVSGVVLKRYLRMANTGDCPTETRLIVGAMVEEAKRVDPDFVEMVGDPPLEKTLEDTGLNPERDLMSAMKRQQQLNMAFDGSLGEYTTAKLIQYNESAPKVVAESVREVTGQTKDEVPDSAALELLQSPARNPYLLDTLNSWTHSPLMRCLNHVNYTFRKKISHTADSQDQRHRMVPASRPLLTRVHTLEPDYIIPPAIEKNKDASKLYKKTMEMLWDSKNKLLECGVSPEFACYLLPNAVALRFTQTGSLANLMHKWRLRTCFLAQEEIYQASMEELSQVRKVHAGLVKYVGPHCVMRKGLVEEKEREGPCPEGSHWCGVRVWENFPKVKRAF